MLGDRIVAVALALAVLERRSAVRPRRSSSCWPRGLPLVATVLWSAAWSPTGSHGVPCGASASAADPPVRCRPAPEWHSRSPSGSRRSDDPSPASRCPGQLRRLARLTRLPSLGLAVWDPASAAIDQHLALAGLGVAAAMTLTPLSVPDIRPLPAAAPPEPVPQANPAEGPPRW